MSGKLVILSGPSGVGKDTILVKWNEKNRKVKRVVAYTTREPREGEVNGEDYHFVPRSMFDHLAKSGAFLEHKEVFGNGYATPLHDLEEMLGGGQIAVLKIDVQGAQTVMELRPEALSVFLLPPSPEELERRIRERATDSESVIKKRLKGANEEIALSSLYKYQVVNDDVDVVIIKLEEIVK